MYAHASQTCTLMCASTHVKEPLLGGADMPFVCGLGVASIVCMWFFVWFFGIITALVEG